MRRGNGSVLGKRNAPTTSSASGVWSLKKVQTSRQSSVWPVLAILTLPLTVVTFGLFLLVVNGIALKIAAAITPGFAIIGFMPAVIGSIVLTIVGWLIRFVVYGGNIAP